MTLPRIQKRLSGLDGAFAFIDDIILGNTNEFEHKKLLYNVFQRIQDYGFKLRIEKCEFSKEEFHSAVILSIHEAFNQTTTDHEHSSNSMTD